MKKPQQGEERPETVLLETELLAQLEPAISLDALDMMDARAEGGGVQGTFL